LTKAAILSYLTFVKFFDSIGKDSFELRSLFSDFITAPTLGHILEVQLMLNANQRTVGAFIPIRLGSSRLPGKALHDLHGKPVVIRLLERLLTSQHLHRENIVVCTTTEKTDDPLVELLNAEGWLSFRGNRDDIIHRFFSANEKYGFDIIGQIDGDDPLADIPYLDKAVEVLLADSALGASLTEGLPLGLNTKAFTSAALSLCQANYLTTQNDTGFSLLITESGICKVQKIRVEDERLKHNSARLTLDHEEDLALFRRIWELLSTSSAIFGTQEIVTLLKSQPELCGINGYLSAGYQERTRSLVKLRILVDGKEKEIKL
jgi:spore coat polysaccharide biosynthesis protein SpsF